MLFEGPLFPGDSEIGQLSKIFEALGTPTKDDWPVGFVLSTASNGLRLIFLYLRTLREWMGFRITRDSQNIPAHL